jgi:hypothetical protein
MVEEPTPEAALGCLLGLRAKYESHHGVRFTPEALAAAVSAAQRYIPDRCAGPVWGRGRAGFRAGFGAGLCWPAGALLVCVGGRRGAAAAAAACLPACPFPATQ